jgi:peptidoglycan/xylan/chitin deacetylase (PgdA/CDA1 family)
MAEPLMILLLHHLGAPPASVRRRKLYLKAEALHSHVAWLKARGYRFTTLSNAIAGEGNACVTFDDGFRDVLTLGLPVLQALQVPATVFAVTSRVGDSAVTFDGDEGVAPADLMAWEELEQLHAAGWEIGSHAHQHVRLPALPAEARRQNLQDSARALREHFGVASALAYPYGAYDGATLSAARDAGFTCGATTRSGRATRDEPYRLRRVILSSFGALGTFERLKLFGVHAGLYPLRERPL